MFWNQHYSFIKRFWDTYAEKYHAVHDVELASHEKRMLVVAYRIEDTMEEARASALPGHDEFWKFLGPYGWSRVYMGPDGKPAKIDAVRREIELVGELDEAARQRMLEIAERCPVHRMMTGYATFETRLKG